MGVKIHELCPSTELEFSGLAGKKVAVDASIFLYQFLATIRGPDGSLLTDSKGNVTSHLIGLLGRTTTMMRAGILPCYVFDGKPPDFKRATIEQRAKLKAEARRLYEEAEAEGDTEGMRKFAGRTTKLTPEMTAEAKELIAALGLPVIQAPSEGEAEAAFLAEKGKVWAVVSQDSDSLLFKAPRLVRNLAVSGKRKRQGVLAYEEVKPQLIELDKVLSSLGISHRQLLALSLLVGTDYNPGGVKGIGPQKALKLVKEHGEDFDAIFSAAKWSEHNEVDWKDIMAAFDDMPVEDVELVWKRPDETRIRALLVEKHDFSEERVRRAVEGIAQQHTKRAQTGLGAFL